MSGNGELRDISLEEVALGGTATETPRSFDLEIDPPINYLKKPFTVLHLEEPTALMMQKAEAELTGTPTAYSLRRFQIQLVALASHTPREVIEQMRVSQVQKAFDFLGRLLPGGRETGEN